MSTSSEYDVLDIGLGPSFPMSTVAIANINLRDLHDNSISTFKYGEKGTSRKLTYRIHS